MSNKHILTIHIIMKFPLQNDPNPPHSPSIPNNPPKPTQPHSPAPKIPLHFTVVNEYAPFLTVHFVWNASETFGGENGHFRIRREQESSAGARSAERWWKHPADIQRNAARYAETPADRDGYDSRLVPPGYRWILNLSGGRQTELFYYSSV